MGSSRLLVFRVYRIRNSPSCGGPFPRKTSFVRTKRKRVHNPATHLPSRGNRFASLNIIAPLHASSVMAVVNRDYVYRAIDPNESTGILNYRPLGVVRVPCEGEGEGQRSRATTLVSALVFQPRGKYSAGNIRFRNAVAQGWNHCADSIQPCCFASPICVTFATSNLRILLIFVCRLFNWHFGDLCARHTRRPRVLKFE